MKNFIINNLPKFLAERIILVAQWLKKNIRFLNRLIKFGYKPFFKYIKINDVHFFIQLQPLKNACIDETIALTGTWEKTMSQQLTKFIKPGDTFIDIGANIGYHSLFVASLLKNTGKVHAFEPIPHLCQQIINSIEKNHFNNVQVYQTGLGDHESTMPLYLRDENMGGSSLFAYDNLNLVKTSSTKQITIKTLDSIFPPDTKVDLIKIDVEGYELEALTGAKKLLEAQKPTIFIEFSPIFYNQENPQKSYDLINLLTTIGYSFSTMDNATIDLKSWLQQTKSPGQIDIICKNNKVS